MKLNLPQTEIDKILESLEVRNAAVYSPDAFTRYYFTYKEIPKFEETLTQFVFILGEVEQKLAKELKEKGNSMGYNFAIMIRDSDLRGSIANGKILYMYFFANNKLYTTIPDSIIKDEYQSEVTRNVVIVPD